MEFEEKSFYTLNDTLTNFFCFLDILFGFLSSGDGKLIREMCQALFIEQGALKLHLNLSGFGSVGKKKFSLNTCTIVRFSSLG